MTAPRQETRYTVVLLHAMGSSHRMWRAQIDALAQRYHVLAPDLPGHGGRADRFSLAAAVAELGELPHPVHVVGASLGATVALRFAVTHPARLASLTISGATVRPPRAKIATQRAATAALPLSVSAAVSARLVRSARREDREALVADIRRAGKRGQLDALRELGRWDPQPELPAIRVPTLVCCGERDRTNLPSARLLAERIPHATLVVIPGGGHLWPMHDPDVCAQTIGRFLAAAGQP